MRVNVSGTRLEAGGQPGWLADEDGWMNVNISFTLLSQRLGWFICLRCLCHFACLTRTPTTPTDGSFGATPHPPGYECICVRRMVIAGIAPPAGHVGARKTARSINVHLSTWVDIRFPSTIVFFIEMKQVVFFKNKCMKTSMEIWSHAALAHYKWFLSAGGYLLAPSPAAFSHKLPLKLFFICRHHLSRHSHARIKLPSHWVSLCFNLILFKDKGHSEMEIKRHQFALSSLFLLCVCVLLCIGIYTFMGYSGGPDKMWQWWERKTIRLDCLPGLEQKQVSFLPCETSTSQTKTWITLSWNLLPQRAEIALSRKTACSGIWHLVKCPSVYRVYNGLSNTVR